MAERHHQTRRSETEEASVDLGGHLGASRGEDDPVIEGRPEYGDGDFDRYGYLAAARRGLGDVLDLSPRVSLAHVGTPDGAFPQVAVTLSGGRFEDVAVILSRARIVDAPRSVWLPTWRPGSALIEWPRGELGGVSVCVRWLVDNPGEAAAELEAAE